MPTKSKTVTIKIEGIRETLWGYLYELKDKPAFVEWQAIDYNNGKENPWDAGESVNPVFENDLNKIINYMLGNIELSLEDSMVDAG